MTKNKRLCVLCGCMVWCVTNDARLDKLSLEINLFLTVYNIDDEQKVSNLHIFGNSCFDPKSKLVLLLTFQQFLASSLKIKYRYPEVSGANFGFKLQFKSWKSLHISRSRPI